MVNPILALMQRLREHVDAERGQSTNAPVVGGMYNTPIVGLPARVAGAGLNLAGLAQEPFNKVANAGAGEIGLLASLAQVKFGDPNSTATQAARLALAQGPAHPGRAIEAMRTGPDTGTALLAGALELASNPLNYVGGIGEAGTALRAGGEAASAAGNASTAATLAQGAGRALQGAALTGEIVNRAGMLPLALSPRGFNRMLETPAFLRTAGSEISSPLRGALERLNTTEAVPPVPRPDLSVLRGGKLGAAEPLGLPLIPEPLDLRLAQRERGIPQATRVPDLGLSPLEAEQTPNLLQIARKAQNAAENGPLVAPQRMPGPLPPLPTDRPAPVQPLGDLLGAARRTAQPSLLEQLQGVAGRLNLGEKPPTPPTPRLPIPLPPGAVTRAEERAARAVPDLIDNAAPPALAGDFPQLGGTREDALAQLSSDELTTLVNTAYPVEEARASAILKYRNPVELAGAAVDRITRDGRLAGALSATDDALARKLAYLPEPGEVAAVAAPAARTATQATYPAFLSLIRSVTGDLPLPTSDFYPKKLGVAAEDVPALFKQAADEGIIGELPMEPGRFAVKPSAPSIDIPAPQDLPDMAPDSEFVAAIQRAAQASKDDEVNALVDVANAFGLDQGQAQRIADEALGITGREADQAATLAETRLQDIEASPYFAAFKYFNPRGELKATNPITGKRIINRTNGRISAMREGVGNVVGNGYDEVADNLIAQAQAGGHNQNYNQTSEEFWTEAQKAFKEWQQLTGAPTEVLGPMGLRKPKGNTGVPAPSLPGVDMRPQFGGGNFTSVADNIPSGAAAPLKLEMQYGKLAPEAVQRVKAVDAGQQAFLGLPSTERKLKALGIDTGSIDPLGVDLSTPPNRRDFAADLNNPGVVSDEYKAAAAGYSANAAAAQRATQLTDLRGYITDALKAGDTDELAYLKETATGREAGYNLTPAEFDGLVREASNAATIARGAAAKADLFGDAADVAAQVTPQVERAASQVASPLDLSRDDYIAQQINATKFSTPLPENLKTGGRRGANLDRDIDRLNAVKERAGREWDRAARAEQKANPPAPKVKPGDPDFTSVPTEKLQAFLQSRQDRLNSLLALRAQFPGDKSLNPDLAVVRRHIKQINTELAARQAAPVIGGDIAAGGGGAKFVYPGGTLAVRGVQHVMAHPTNAATGIIGAGIGAGVGAATNEDDRMGGALKGASIGAAVGYGAPSAASAFDSAAREAAQAVGDRFVDTAADPLMWRDMFRAGWKELRDQGLTSTVHGPKEAWDAFWSQQRAQVVNTFKQLPQDAATERLTIEGIARDEFPGLTDRVLRATTGILREERAAGVPLIDSQLPFVQDMKALGLDGLIADEKAAGDLLGIDYGGSLATDATRKQFGPVGRTLAGVGIGAMSAVKTVNPMAVGYGAVRGLAAPFVDAAIRFANGIQHDKFRFALAHLALRRDVPHLAEDFLSELARAGHNVRPLEGRGGMFSAKEVAAVAGPQAAEDWQGLLVGLVKAQGDRIAFLGGDFRDKLAKDYTGNVTTGDRVLGTVEKGIGKAAPFSRWGIHYAPVLAEIAIRHPRAALIVGREMDRQQDEIKAQGKKAYQAGYTITDKTPGLGLAARIRNGGGEGSLTIDPLGSFVPYGGMLGGEEPPADATGYQRAVGLADKVGFSPNPVIQSLAYITGQDYRTPGNLSRTAGLEAGVEAIPAAARLAGLPVPDLPQLPSGRNLLDAGRTVLKPVTGEGAVAATDPVLRRYAELVLATTKKPLMDDSNRDYQMGINNPDNPLWNLATVQARTAGAATNATGLVSPVQTTAQSREAAQAQQAGPLPISDYQISQAPKSQQAGLRAQLDRVIALNPATATYRNINPNARRATLLAEFDLKNARLKQMAPQLYAERRKQYEASLP